MTDALAYLAAAVPVVAFLFSLGCWCGATDCSSFCIETWSSYSTGTDISTPSSCGWTEVNGDSTIVANGLSFTTALASASCNASPTAAYILVRGVIVTSGGGGTDDARILLDFVDNSNYLAAEFKHVNGGTSTISLIRRAAGVETTVKSKNLPLVVTPGNEVKFCVYYDGTTILFTCDGGSAGAYGCIQIANTSESITNAKYGLGSGNTVTNSIVFVSSNAQNFQSPDYGNAPCEDCFLGNSTAQRYDMANEFTVTFSGCSCGGMNTSFTLTSGGSVPVTAPNTTLGYALNMTPISGIDGITLQFVQNGANVDIYVYATNSTAFGGPKSALFYQSSWKTSHPTTGIDSISGLSIPYNSDTGSGCDFSGATCTITAVDPITS